MITLVWSTELGIKAPRMSKLFQHSLSYSAIKFSTFVVLEGLAFHKFDKKVGKNDRNSFQLKKAMIKCSIIIKQL